MKKVSLVRHGQSEANAGLATDNPATINLTDEGLEQGRRFADGCPIASDLIITSPYIRTKRTASFLIDKFPFVPVEEWTNTFEITYLSPPGCKHTTAAQRRGRVEAYWDNHNPDYIDGVGAESFHQFMLRIMSFLDDLQKRNEENMVAFSHGCFMQAVVWYVLNGRYENSGSYMERFVHFFKSYPVGNCSSISLVLFDGTWFVSK